MFTTSGGAGVVPGFEQALCGDEPDSLCVGLFRAMRLLILAIGSGERGHASRTCLLR